MPVTSCFYICQKIISSLNSGDYWVRPLSAAMHVISSSFENNFEVRGVSVYTLEVFRKVQNKRIIHKLQQNGISGNFLILLTNSVIKESKKLYLTATAYLGLISVLVSFKVPFWVLFSSSFAPVAYLVIISVILICR